MFLEIQMLRVGKNKRFVYTKRAIVRKWCFAKWLRQGPKLLPNACNDCSTFIKYAFQNRYRKRSTCWSIFISILSRLFSLGGLDGPKTAQDGSNKSMNGPKKIPKHQRLDNFSVLAANCPDGTPDPSKNVFWSMLGRCFNEISFNLI